MTNGFTKRKVGTLTLGEKLRKLRSDKRIALNEVSRVTKIRVEYLQYLEEGRYDELPADVYTRGFLKSYGDFLGVSEQSLYRLFEKEKGIKKNLEKSKNPKKVDSKIKTLNISAFVFTPKKITLFFVAFLVLGALFYLYREAGSLTDMPRLIIFSPETNSQIDGNTVTLEGKTDKDALIFINNQPALVDDEGKFKENISLQSGINVISVKAINRFQKEMIESVTVQARFPEEVPDALQGTNFEGDFSNQETSENNENQLNLELTVDPGPVWISVEADGNLVFSGTILSGVVQNFEAHDRIVVSSGKADATYIKLNGEDKGALGKESGAIKDVVFAKEDKKQ
jgi:cytoskeletal protein RodZ